jgi:hypothetical protein
MLKYFTHFLHKLNENVWEQSAEWNIQIQREEVKSVQLGLWVK